MAKAAAETMSRMGPEEIRRMADMAATMNVPGAAAGGAPGMGAASNPAMTPEMIKMVGVGMMMSTR